MSKNGLSVYVDLIHSAAGEHIAQQPYILTLAKDLLGNYDLRGTEMVVEHDFGRPIGSSEVVETTDKDAVVYAKRLKHTSYSRFVRRRQLTPSTFLSMSVRRDDAGLYELVDVWIGQQAPPFPTEELQEPASTAFWENHAIVLDGQPLQLRTITKDLPF